MVYCGKPSRGCKNCRERKIRCDTAAPACGQCKKANKQCPGYRNQLDLAFRNESSSVIQKAKAKAKKNLAKTREASSERGSSPTATSENDPCCTSVSAVVASDPSSPNAKPNTLSFSIWAARDRIIKVPVSTFSMYPTSEELGINYFISNYVQTASGPSHGYFSYVPDLFREEGMNDAMKLSIVATGLAGFANITKSPQLVRRARAEYAVALRNINAALQSPVESVKNGTLLAIMVLSIFENVTGSSQLSLKAWIEHVNGAATILKLRGRSQLTNSVGFTLFIHVASVLLSSCVAREIPMPLQIRELRLEAFSLRAPDPCYKLLRVMDEFTVFRAALRTGEITDLQTIIETALKFDGDLMQIFSNVPSDWLYETVYNDESMEMAYNGSYDIYYDLWVTQVWNSMRLCRILLNENIRLRILEGFTVVPPLFTTAEYTAQFQLSTDVLGEMRDGILRSVPQCIGQVTRKPFAQQYRVDDFDEISFTDLLNDDLQSYYPSPRPSPPIRPGQAIGGHFLMWPLYLAGISRIGSPIIRTMVSTRLRYIGEKMGILQATALGNFLDAGALISEKSGAVKKAGSSPVARAELLRFRGRLAEEGIGSEVAIAGELDC